MYKVFLFFIYILKIAESRRAFISVHKNNIINNKMGGSPPPSKNVLFQTPPKIALSQAITKKQIIEEVAMETKENKKTVEKIMNGILDNIYKHLENNEKIYIHKFGIYYNVFRKKRSIKNVKTKEEIQVESSHSPYFKFSKIFKDLIKTNVKVKKEDDDLYDDENSDQKHSSHGDEDENGIEEENLHKRNINESFNENLNEKLIY